ncbi:MAG: 16S rRNA (cytosine(1402)-N(4))-methyltransferase RsmH [Gemmatimonadetes bacterium]|nr:16S rRNA (cytosine(1402)-N(4))-methyltransferase RsmH [Gemmatimonadota bacterium]
MTTSQRRSSGSGEHRVPAHDFHAPVLLEQAMSYLIERDGLYLDGTVGGGGHAEAILARCPGCRVLAVDRDTEALDAARERLSFGADRVVFARMSFRDAPRHPLVREEKLAGALLDLGVSSHQLDHRHRGFTFRRGARLDMRMDQSTPPSAADYLAEAPRDALARALREGQAPRPAAVAARIVRRRASRPFATSDDLVAVLEAVLRRRAGHAEKARLFQALRIRVNDEIGALTDGLPAIRDALRPGGVFVGISYHSVEDAIVKRAFRDWSDPSHGLPPRLPVRAADLEPLGRVLTKKPVTAPPGETEVNPRARPARLRAWRKAA